MSLTFTFPRIFLFFLPDQLVESRRPPKQIMVSGVDDDNDGDDDDMMRIQRQQASNGFAMVCHQFNVFVFVFNCFRFDLAMIVIRFSLYILKLFIFFSVVSFSDQSCI